MSDKVWILKVLLKCNNEFSVESVHSSWASAVDRKNTLAEHRWNAQIEEWPVLDEAKSGAGD